MKKCAFVDRDGTFIWEPERSQDIDPRETFPLDIKDFRFMKGATQGLKALTNKGYELVLVTNQSFLGTSKHPRQMFDSIMKRMFDELGEQGIYFSFVMVCPHGPDEGCDCRKPKIGGLKEFLEKNKEDIDLKGSFMFGDRDTDREFAENLGVRFVKIEKNQVFVLPEDV